MVKSNPLPGRYDRDEQRKKLTIQKQKVQNDLEITKRPAAFVSQEMARSDSISTRKPFFYRLPSGKKLFAISICMRDKIVWLDKCKTGGNTSVAEKQNLWDSLLKLGCPSIVLHAHIDLNDDEDVQVLVNDFKKSHYLDPSFHTLHPQCNARNDDDSDDSTVTSGSNDDLITGGGDNDLVAIAQDLVWKQDSQDVVAPVNDGSDVVRTIKTILQQEDYPKYRNTIASYFRQVRMFTKWSTNTMEQLITYMTNDSNAVDQIIRLDCPNIVPVDGIITQPVREHYVELFFSSPFSNIIVESMERCPQLKQTFLVADKLQQDINHLRRQGIAKTQAEEQAIKSAHRVANFVTAMSSPNHSPIMEFGGQTFYHVDAARKSVRFAPLNRDVLLRLAGLNRNGKPFKDLHAEEQNSLSVVDSPALMALTIAALDVLAHKKKNEILEFNKNSKPSQERSINSFILGILELEIAINDARRLVKAAQIHHAKEHGLEPTTLIRPVTSLGGAEFSSGRSLDDFDADLDFDSEDSGCEAKPNSLGPIPLTRMLGGVGSHTTSDYSFFGDVPKIFRSQLYEGGDLTVASQSLACSLFAKFVNNKGVPLDVLLARGTNVRKSLGLPELPVRPKARTRIEVHHMLTESDRTKVNKLLENPHQTPIMINSTCVLGIRNMFSEDFNDLCLLIMNRQRWDREEGARSGSSYYRADFVTQNESDRLPRFHIGSGKMLLAQRACPAAVAKIRLAEEYLCVIDCLTNQISRSICFLQKDDDMDLAFSAWIDCASYEELQHVTCGQGSPNISPTQSSDDSLPGSPAMKRAREDPKSDGDRSHREELLDNLLDYHAFADSDHYSGTGEAMSEEEHKIYTAIRELCQIYPDQKLAYNPLSRKHQNAMISKAHGDFGPHKDPNPLLASTNAWPDKKMSVGGVLPTASNFVVFTNTCAFPTSKVPTAVQHGMALPDGRKQPYSAVHTAQNDGHDQRQLANADQKHWSYQETPSSKWTPSLLLVDHLPALEVDKWRPLSSAGNELRNSDFFPRNIRNINTARLCPSPQNDLATHSQGIVEGECCRPNMFVYNKHDHTNVFFHPIDISSNEEYERPIDWHDLWEADRFLNEAKGRATATGGDKTSDSDEDGPRVSPVSPNAIFKVPREHLPSPRKDLIPKKREPTKEQWMAYHEPVIDFTKVFSGITGGLSKQLLEIAKLENLPGLPVSKKLIRLTSNSMQIAMHSVTTEMLLKERKVAVLVDGKDGKTKLPMSPLFLHSSRKLPIPNGQLISKRDVTGLKSSTRANEYVDMERLNVVAAIRFYKSVDPKRLDFEIQFARLSALMVEAAPTTAEKDLLELRSFWQEHAVGTIPPMQIPESLSTLLHQAKGYLDGLRGDAPMGARLPNAYDIQRQRSHYSAKHHCDHPHWSDEIVQKAANEDFAAHITNPYDLDLLHLSPNVRTMISNLSKNPGIDLDAGELAVLRMQAVQVLEREIRFYQQTGIMDPDCCDQPESFLPFDQIVHSEVFQIAESRDQFFKAHEAMVKRLSPAQCKLHEIHTKMRHYDPLYQVGASGSAMKEGQESVTPSNGRGDTLYNSAKSQSVKSVENITFQQMRELGNSVNFFVNINEWTSVKRRDKVDVMVTKKKTEEEPDEHKGMLLSLGHLRYDRVASGDCMERCAVMAAFKNFEGHYKSNATFMTFAGSGFYRNSLRRAFGYDTELQIIMDWTNPTNEIGYKVAFVNSDNIGPTFGDKELLDIAKAKDFNKNSQSLIVGHANWGKPLHAAVHMRDSDVIRCCCSGKATELLHDVLGELEEKAPSAERLVKPCKAIKPCSLDVEKHFIPMLLNNMRAACLRSLPDLCCIRHPSSPDLTPLPLCQDKLVTSLAERPSPCHLFSIDVQRSFFRSEANKVIAQLDCRNELFAKKKLRLGKVHYPLTEDLSTLTTEERKFHKKFTETFPEEGKELEDIFTLRLVRGKTEHWKEMADVLSDMLFMAFVNRLVGRLSMHMPYPEFKLARSKKATELRSDGLQDPDPSNLLLPITKEQELNEYLDYLMALEDNGHKANHLLIGQCDRRIPPSWTSKTSGFLDLRKAMEACATHPKHGIPFVRRYLEDCFNPNVVGTFLDRDQLRLVLTFSQGKVAPELRDRNVKFLVHQQIVDLECVLPSFAGPTTVASVGSAFGGEFGLMCHSRTRAKGKDAKDRLQDLHERKLNRLITVSKENPVMLVALGFAVSHDESGILDLRTGDSYGPSHTEHNTCKDAVTLIHSHPSRQAEQAKQNKHCCHPVAGTPEQVQFLSRDQVLTDLFLEAQNCVHREEFLHKFPRDGLIWDAIYATTGERFLADWCQRGSDYSD